MISVKHKELFEQLYARTRENSIAWTETAQKGTYRASFASHSLEISQEFLEDGPDAEAIIRIVVRNDNGDPIETFTDGAIGGSGLLATDAARIAFYRKCEELFALAERKALGTEDALDNILKELKDMLPF